MASVLDLAPHVPLFAQEVDLDSAAPLYEAGMIDDGEHSDQRALRAVASEISSLAGPVAATTSVVNALAKAGAPLVSADTLLANLPPPAVVYPAVLQRLAVEAAEPDTFAEIQHFHLRLAHAQKAAARYCRGSGVGSIRGGVHLEVLASTWQDVSATTVRLIELLTRTDRNGNAVRWALGPPPACGQMLEEAAAGRWPCVLEDGRVDVPGIAERRQAPRFPVSWPAAMLHRGEMLPIRIDDVSLEGLGVACAAPVAIDDRVVVELMGRLLSARVSWTGARRLGLELAVRLRATDPIITTARGG